MTQAIKGAKTFFYAMTPHKSTPCIALNQKKKIKKILEYRNVKNKVGKNARSELFKSAFYSQFALGRAELSSSYFEPRFRAEFELDTTLSSRRGAPLGYARLNGALKVIEKMPVGIEKWRGFFL